MRRDVFQAIADPIRRDIIHLMARQDAMTPNSVAEQFDISRQGVSKHLRILSECGLILIKQKGRERYCYVQPKPLEEVNDWLDEFQRSWDYRFEKLDKLLIEMKSQTSTKKRSK